MFGFGVIGQAVAHRTLFGSVNFSGHLTVGTSGIGLCHTLFVCLQCQFTIYVVRQAWVDIAWDSQRRVRAWQGQWCGRLLRLRLGLCLLQWVACWLSLWLCLGLWLSDTCWVLKVIPHLTGFLQLRRRLLIILQNAVNVRTMLTVLTCGFNTTAHDTQCCTERSGVRARPHNFFDVDVVGVERTIFAQTLSGGTGYHTDKALFETLAQHTAGNLFRTVEHRRQFARLRNKLCCTGHQVLSRLAKHIARSLRCCAGGNVISHSTQCLLNSETTARQQGLTQCGITCRSATAQGTSRRTLHSVEQPTAEISDTTCQQTGGSSRSQCVVSILGCVCVVRTLLAQYVHCITRTLDGGRAGQQRRIQAFGDRLQHTCSATELCATCAEYLIRQTESGFACGLSRTFNHTFTYGSHAFTDEVQAFSPNHDTQCGCQFVKRRSRFVAKCEQGLRHTTGFGTRASRVLIIVGLQIAPRSACGNNSVVNLFVPVHLTIAETGGFPRFFQCVHGVCEAERVSVARLVHTFRTLINGGVDGAGKVCDTTDCTVCQRVTNVANRTPKAAFLCIKQMFIGTGFCHCIFDLFLDLVFLQGIPVFFFGFCVKPVVQHFAIPQGRAVRVDTMRTIVELVGRSDELVSPLVAGGHGGGISGGLSLLGLGLCLLLLRHIRGLLLGERVLHSFLCLGDTRF